MMHQPHSEEAAFRMVLKHWTPLKSAVRFYISDPFLAEETFSDVMIEIVRSWATYDSGRRFLPWARIIIRRVALANLFSRNQEVHVLDDEIFEEATDLIGNTGDQAEQDEITAALRECMARLSPEHQLLLRQRYFEEYSYREIAQRTQKSESALYTLFNRLRELLSQCIQRKRAQFL